MSTPALVSLIGLSLLWALMWAPVINDLGQRWRNAYTVRGDAAPQKDTDHE